MVLHVPRDLEQLIGIIVTRVILRVIIIVILMKYKRIVTPRNILIALMNKFKCCSKFTIHLYFNWDNLWIF